MPPQGQEQVSFSFHFVHVLTINITLNDPVLGVMRLFGQCHYQREKRQKFQMLARRWSGGSSLFAQGGMVSWYRSFKQLAGSFNHSKPYISSIYTRETCAHVSRKTCPRMSAAARIAWLETTHKLLEEVMEMTWPLVDLPDGPRQSEAPHTFPCPGNVRSVHSSHGGSHSKYVALRQ